MFYLRYFILALFRPKSRIFLEYKLFRYLNKERKAVGLWSLFFQNDLRDVARKHSQDMAKKSYFAHEAKDGSSPKDRFERSNVSEAIAGENLAKVRGFKNPVLVSHDGLMNSPGHKANILSKDYNCVGIGLAISLDKTYYFTQNFSYRYILLNRLPKKLWFRKKFNLKGKIILDEVEELLFVIKNSYNKEEVERQYLKIDSKSFKVSLNFPDSTRYEVLVYVKLKNNIKYKVSNTFEISRAWF